MGGLTRLLIAGCAMYFNFVSNGFAGNPQEVMSDFSTQLVDIFKGPIAKILAALILMGGVAALLRGRHKLAVSCGLAFIILLFLPILLEQVG